MTLVRFIPRSSHTQRENSNDILFRFFVLFFFFLHTYSLLPTFPSLHILFLSSLFSFFSLCFGVCVCVCVSVRGSLLFVSVLYVFVVVFVSVFVFVWGFLGRTAVAVAGADYCILAADTRLSLGYAIQTRNSTKIMKM